MATYYGTYGQKVQYLASDPSDPQLGQVWYNSTSATLKVRGFTTTNAWASASNYPGPSRSYPGGFGVQTAAVMVGGYDPTTYATVGLYTGSTWTTGTSYPTPVRQIMIGGMGTQTAGLQAGGYNTVDLNTANEFDGTTWTAGGNISTARSDGGAAGLQNSGLIFGGSTSAPTPYVTASESYNGSTWTNTPSLNTARFGQGAGTQNEALMISGYLNGGPTTTDTEKYNGSSWTTVNPVNTGRYGGSTFGSGTVAVIAGGQGPNGRTNTETWNGTSWTNNTALPGARQYMGGGGIPGGQGVTFGGDDGGLNPRPALQTTQLWNGSYESTQTVTVS